MGSNTGDEKRAMSHVSSEEEEACSLALTITSGVVPPMVLKAVVDLDVLEIIKREGGTRGGYMSPVEIAGHLPTTNPEVAAAMLDRMLWLLASYEVVTWQLRTLADGRVERTFGLAPVCRFLTKNEDAADAVALIHEDKVIMDSWYYLKDAVLHGGIPFNKAHGMSAFEYNETDPVFNKVFNSNMSLISITIMKKVLENYKGFEGISTLVDVGGGTGATLNMIIAKCPFIKGINFDLPHVINDAPSYPGVEHVAGDMFVSIPKGDAIFMKWILHDWSDELCLKILKNSYDALSNQGKVIICDYIMPMTPEASNATRSVLHCDVCMLAVNPGGKERTQKEFENLAKASGFQGFKVACFAYDFKVMEFFKNI